MYSRDYRYFNDNTSTVGHRSHRAFSTDLIFIDDFSTGPQFIF